jgi:hypothetical protein
MNNGLHAGWWGFMIYFQEDVERIIHIVIFSILPILTIILIILFYFQIFPLTSEPITHSLLLDETFVVERNRLVYYKIELAAGERVLGIFKETNKFCVDFYILNESDFYKIIGKTEDFIPYLVAKKVSTYNFTFTAPRQGIYYFVFDNGYTREDPICYDKNVEFKLYRI